MLAEKNPADRKLLSSIYQQLDSGIIKYWRAIEIHHGDTYNGSHITGEQGDKARKAIGSGFESILLIDSNGLSSERYCEWVSPSVTDYKRINGEL